MDAIHGSGMNSWILTLVTFVPAIGAAVLMLFPRGAKVEHHGHDDHDDPPAFASDNTLKWIALVVSLLAFVLSLHLPFHWDYTQAGFQQKFEVDRIWIASPEIHYHLGVDGISMWLVILTTFLVPLSIISSWNSIHGRVKEFMVLMLLQETAMVGVFLALDMFLFYLFWEMTLIPMALLIGIYGHGRRVYAAVKFFLYTMLASMFMLASLIWLYVKVGSLQYGVIQEWTLNWQNHFGPSFPQVATWLFLGFFISFAVKVPIFPFHTWLPDAHVEAPTAGSILLAGVLLKMGTYGLMRFNVALFPGEARRHAPWIITLAVIGIIYGALVALVQPNMKKLVAYSSVSHLGFVVLGIFSFTQMGADGAVYQMLNHGVSTGALFMMLGYLYDRRHTYEIAQYGGIATPMPVFSTIFLIITLSSIGLPLLNGFVGEFLTLAGAFQVYKWSAILGVTGVIWSAGYMLWLYQRTFYGENWNTANHGIGDVNGREQLALIPLAMMAVVMGVLSPYWMRAIDPSSKLINEAGPSTQSQMMTEKIANAK